MNINLTLIGQSIIFILFVAFCMKFIWPPIMAALAERKKQIADGLAAGEKGKHELQLAEKRAIDILKEAKQRATGIIALAEKRASEIHEESKESAKVKAARIIQAAQDEIDMEINRAREKLRTSVSQLAIAGARQILKKEIDAKTHAQLLDQVAKQL